MSEPSREIQPAHWRSAHIYYYEPDKTGLLLDAVRPLLARLRDITPDAHVLRHWRRGPHLRLNIRAETQTWTQTVQPAIEEVIGSYLAAHPSTARLEESALLAQHKLLADQEQEHGPLTPWFPDNTIQYVAYDDRLHVLVDTVAAELLADFYTDTTPLLFDMLEHIRCGHDTAELLGLGVMLANSMTAYPPLTYSYVSYRSHAEGYIASCADPEATRTRFDAYYRNNQALFTERARAVIAAVNDPQAVSVPFIREWTDVISAYRARATPLIAEGKLIRPPVFDEKKAAGLRTELHRMMFTNHAYHNAVFNNPGFSRYRLLLNYTYLHITRLGLTPPQRLRLCHLAANTVEDLYRINALESIRDFVQQHPNREAASA
jgi:hypothetical protein